MKFGLYCDRNIILLFLIFVFQVIYVNINFQKGFLEDLIIYYLSLYFIEFFNIVVYLLFEKCKQFRIVRIIEMLCK